MSNRVDNPNLTEKRIIRNLSAQTNRANYAPVWSLRFSIDRRRYQSQSAPMFAWGVDTKFDVISVNPPYPRLHPNSPSDQLERAFRRCADQWYLETRRDSSITRILSNENYLRVIELGTPVIPLILEELRRRPRPWFLVLRVLTKNNEIGKGYPGNFEKMAEAWISWGKERGLTR